MKPFCFAKDTSYGVKEAWDGTGEPHPTSFKLGYNRTIAYPPILISVEAAKIWAERKEVQKAILNMIFHSESGETEKRQIQLSLRSNLKNEKLWF